MCGSENIFNFEDFCIVGVPFHLAFYVRYLPVRYVFFSATITLEEMIAISFFIYTATPVSHGAEYYEAFVVYTFVAPSTDW